jgi:hypothetical protein
VSSKTYEEQLRDAGANANALEQLVSMPGWKLLEAEGRQMLAMYEEEMKKATTGDLAMKAATAYVATKAVLDWPTKFMTNVAAAIKRGA